MQHIPGKRQANKQRRKEDLYSVAMDLFRRQGFDDTRVEEITQAAGVAKGTFFNYFPTKEDVLLYIGERHMSRLGSALNNGTGRRLSEERSAVAALKLLLRTLALSLHDDRDLVRLAVDKAMKITHMAPASEGRRFGFQALVALLIRRGQQTGEIHPAADPELVAQMIEGLYYQQLVIWCQENFSFDLAERLEQVVDLLIVGIGVKHIQPAADTVSH
ncbi:MAG: TetR/AcrR family transcriptional regulator [Caldilineae bacterium]|nr:TetR/AcrR family transcriptional regulator [Anaerolineae bacterium]MCB0200463.1 TetR/AcrR family transcriptional regulator [Anaerolineae bacterium]MCB0203797.1 TetR/AcrR family transcriptional regulator [Anaerolineae bacterium]MCB0252282.1 TetR/AcrR family transcriptional regulator [Anaerolineae bacterium]MCB9154268.1 TetR/AcrR family transcriptional regulator [Caldilineae bacterium]